MNDVEPGAANAVTRFTNARKDQRLDLAEQPVRRNVAEHVAADTSAADTALMGQANARRQSGVLHPDPAKEAVRCLVCGLAQANDGPILETEWGISMCRRCVGFLSVYATQ